MLYLAVNCMFRKPLKQIQKMQSKTLTVGTSMVRYCLSWVVSGAPTTTFCWLQVGGRQKKILNTRPFFFGPELLNPSKKSSTTLICETRKSTKKYKLLVETMGFLKFLWMTRSFTKQCHKPDQLLQCLASFWNNSTVCQATAKIKTVLRKWTCVRISLCMVHMPQKQVNPWQKTQRMYDKTLSQFTLHR